MKKLLLSLLAASLLALAGSTVPAQTVPVRPSESLGEEAVRKSREQLVGQVQQFNERARVAAQTLDAAIKSDDGTALKRAKITLIGLVLEKDKSAPLPLIETSIERVNWAIEKERSQKQNLAARRQLDLVRTERELDRAADDAVALEEKLASLSSGSERRELELKLADRKAEMQALMGQRDERARAARIYSEQAAGYERELAELKIIRNHLDSLTRQARIRVEGPLDAVEHGTVAQATEQLKEEREAMSKILDQIKTQPATPTIPGPPSPIEKVETGPGVKANGISTPPPADSARIDEMLKKARDRKKDKTAPMTKK